MDRETLAQTLNLAEGLKRYIDENGIHEMWFKAHTEAREEAGAEQGTYFSTPYGFDHIDYTLDMSDGTLLFHGTDRDNDYHSFTIDADFILPETRYLALERLKEKYEAQADAANARDARADAERRARDLAEYERLTQVFGKVSD